MTGLSKLRAHFDWPLFVCIAVLIVVGLANLHSATASTTLTLVRQQVGWLVLGLGVFVLSATVDYRLFYRLAYPLYAAGLLALLLVLVFGKSVNASQRWLELFGFAVQPSEPMKVLLILALAKYLHDDPTVEARTLRHVLIPFLLVLAPVVLVLRQPDLGTALLILLLFISIMLLTKLRLRAVLTLLLAVIAASPLIWSYVLRDYQKRRIYTFLDPSSDPGGSGWQSRQSILAVGSGGWSGKGYMQGTQNRLHFLPERWTDFPFAVWAEEWGFIGSVALLVVYIVLVLLAVRRASQARDRFGAVLCVGVAALLFWHTVFSVGMVTGLMPVVGVTLPFVSYGGSSMMTTMCATGLLMNASVRRSAY